MPGYKIDNDRECALYQIRHIFSHQKQKCPYIVARTEAAPFYSLTVTVIVRRLRYNYTPLNYLFNRSGNNVKGEMITFIFAVLNCY